MEFISYEALKPSSNPQGFANCKGMLELVGIYSNDAKELNANYRKWALKYHPDKGFGEKDFFGLVTDCVRTCSEHLEKYQRHIEEGYEEVQSINQLKDQDRIKFIDDLGVLIFGIIVQLHPMWSGEKTHIVLCKTNNKWEPDAQAKKMFVCKESLKQLLRFKMSAPQSAAAAPSHLQFEDVQWRDLKAGDKIHVSYVNVKNPAVTLTAYGVFRSAPTYSEVVEFVKSDETFSNLARSVTVVPLAGSMCKFRRLCSPGRKVSPAAGFAASAFGTATSIPGAVRPQPASPFGAASPFGGATPFMGMPAQTAFAWAGGCGAGVSAESPATDSSKKRKVM